MTWNDPNLQVSARELQESGLIMEINRQVLHPLGMAMWASDGGEIGIARDETHDPTGIVFAEIPPDIAAKRIAAWQKLANSPGLKARFERYGWITQPHHSMSAPLPESTGHES